MKTVWVTYGIGAVMLVVLVAAFTGPWSGLWARYLSTLETLWSLLAVGLAAWAVITVLVTLIAKPATRGQGLVVAMVSAAVAAVGAETVSVAFAISRGVPISWFSVLGPIAVLLYGLVMARVLWRRSGAPHVGTRA